MREIATVRRCVRASVLGVPSISVFSGCSGQVMNAVNPPVRS